MGRNRKPELVPKVAFTGIAEKGKSVGRDEAGRVIFAEGPVPGDVADVLVIKKKKGFMAGVPQHYHHYSEDRVEPFCQHYDRCGGCQWQHLSYEAQAFHKQKVVEDALLRIGKLEIEEMLPIIPAVHTQYYRNKLEFSFSNRRWLTREELQSDTSNLEDVLGFHRAGAFDKVIDIERCWLQAEPSNELRNGIKRIAIAQGLSFHDARQRSGLLRQVMFRLATTGEILVLFSFFEDKPKAFTPFLDAILQEFPQITSLYYCINAKLNDYMFDQEMIHFRGKAYVEEQLGHLRFKIGPKSFFQTNTFQGKELYDVAADFAGLQGRENVYDLYTGIGSIALYLAHRCRQVVGIEEIPEAIEDAEKNAVLNQIDNAVFYAGDVKAILTEAFAAQHGKPDLLVTDPPRAGMHPQVVSMLLQLAAPRIVYVSCNPATQARDLQLLSEKYRLLKSRPVDMFPHTHHIENVALLELR